MGCSRRRYQIRRCHDRRIHSACAPPQRCGADRTVAPGRLGGGTRWWAAPCEGNEGDVGAAAGAGPRPRGGGRGNSRGMNSETVPLRTAGVNRRRWPRCRVAGESAAKKLGVEHVVFHKKRRVEGAPERERTGGTQLAVRGSKQLPTGARRGLRVPPSAWEPPSAAPVGSFHQLVQDSGDSGLRDRRVASYRPFIRSLTPLQDDVRAPHVGGFLMNRSRAAAILRGCARPRPVEKLRSS